MDWPLVRLPSMSSLMQQEVSSAAFQLPTHFLPRCPPLYLELALTGSKACAVASSMRTGVPRRAPLGCFRLRLSPWLPFERASTWA